MKPFLKMFHKILFSYILMCLAFIPARAASYGVLDHQEKADVVFRKLNVLFDLPIEVHSGIYEEYFIGEPDNSASHMVFQMTGIVDDEWCLAAPLPRCVTEVRGIEPILLTTFETVATPYYGAFSLTESLSMADRQSILEEAKLLRLRKKAIDYIVMPHEPNQDLLSHYVQYIDDNGDGIMQEDEITRMRSDAFVEYSYAAAGFPIMDVDITTASGIFTLQLRAGMKMLYPSDQQARMGPATIEKPEVHVYEDETNKELLNDDVTSKESFHVYVKDLLSGPGRLEIWDKEPTPAGTPNFFLHYFFDNIDHNYNSSDLPALGNLPEGKWWIRGIDQAGNWASVDFTIGSTFIVKDDSHTITDKGFAATENITVIAPGNTTRLTLEGPSPFESTFTPVEFSPLYEGEYTVKALGEDDVLIASMTFTNDLTKPKIFIVDEFYNPVGVSTPATTIIIQGEDYGSNIDRIVLDGIGGSTQTFSDGPPTAEARFNGLAIGKYIARVFDRSGNMNKKVFWVTKPPPDSYGQGQMILESNIKIPMPGNGPAYFGSVDVLRTLPDGSHYVAVNKTWEGSYIIKVNAAVKADTVGVISWIYHWDWYSQVSCLETDIDGGAYVMADDKLYKFSLDGNILASVNIYAGFDPYYGVPHKLIVDQAHSRVYAESESVLLVFDTDLNLLSSHDIPFGAAGGIFADDAGDIWAASYGIDDDNNQQLVVSHFSSNLSTITTISQPTELYDREHDGIFMAAAADPRGGVVMLNNGIVWRVTGEGFETPGVARGGVGIPMVVDAEGDLYAGYSVVKISTDNAYVWSPPSLNVGASAITIPKINKLDVAGNVGSDIFISRYAKSFQAVPSDGLATLNSLTQEAKVTNVTSETQIAAAAAAEADALLGVTHFYEVTSGTTVFTVPASITFTYSTTLLSDLGLSPWDIGVYEYDPDNGWVYMDGQYVDEGINKITATIVNNARIFAVFGVAPKSDVYSPDGNVDFYSSLPNAEVSIPPAEEQAAPLVAMAARGLTPAMPLYKITTGSNAFDPTAELWFNYSTTTLAGLGIPADTLSIYSFNTTTGWEELPDQTNYVEWDWDWIYAPISRNAEFFGVFGVAAEIQPAAVIVPSSGPIGAPFVITGSGFGAYSSGITTVLMGGTTAQLAYWSTGTIKGTAPGALSAGEQAVVVMRGTSTIAAAGSFTVTTPALYTLSPSAGAIGVPFTIIGESFGNYSAGHANVLIDGSTVPLTLWTDTRIQGSIPGVLAGGDHEVVVERAFNGGVVHTSSATFTLIAPSAAAVTPSSGAIGVPFTLTGDNFGNYVANNTRVLLGGTTTQLTLWTNTKIQGTVPGTLPAGSYSLVVEREFNGGITRADALPFDVVDMEAWWLAPSSGPIGMPFTITGGNFGNYSANYTHVLIGDTTAPLTLWTDSKIQGTVPGMLGTGQYPVVVERKTADGGVMRTSSMTFEVFAVTVATISPITGPIGMPFVLYGANFGNYLAGHTTVLIGGTTAPLTLWTEGKIQGTIPGNLAVGAYPVVVRREVNGGTVETSTLTFTVAAPYLVSVSPSSGAIGIAFTLTGYNFGNYSAGYTNVLINGTTTPLTLWTDTKIQGTIPGSLGSGQYPLLVERKTSDGSAIQSAAVTFEVVGVNVSSMSPVVGPIGVPFTIYGSNFGNYSAGYTKVLLGGTTTPLTLWSDTKIQGTIPGNFSDGDYPVVVVRSMNGGLVSSSSMTFTVASPVAYAITPSSGPIGLPFTITGLNFGNYVANYTRVLVGGVAAPLTLWADTKVQGTIPGALATGDQTVYVERAINGGLVRTSSFTFTLAAPVLEAVTPSTNAVIAPFMLTGYNFGNYVANYTKVLIGGTTTALTLWSDTKIQGKLPFLLAGKYPVLVQRILNGGLAESATAYITVAEPVISSMTPVSGAVGTAFSLFGTGFGPYDATQTRVTIGGLACTLSLWTDTNIKGTVPTGLGFGTNMVVASRGQALSNGIQFMIPGGHTLSMLRPDVLNADFKLGEVYVYPNPAKGGKVPVFHVEVGVADSVKIKVFTVSGQAVHEHTITGSPAAIGGVYAYEYAWDGHIASGVYYYTMEAEKAGRKLKKAGKFAVVR